MPQAAEPDPRAADWPERAPQDAQPINVRADGTRIDARMRDGAEKPLIEERICRAICRAECLRPNQIEREWPAFRGVASAILAEIAPDLAVNAKLLAACEALVADRGDITDQMLRELAKAEPYNGWAEILSARAAIAEARGQGGGTWE